MNLAEFLTRANKTRLSQVLGQTLSLSHQKRSRLYDSGTVLSLLLVNRSGVVPPPELSCLPPDCTLSHLVDMAREAAAAEAVQIAPYVSLICSPAGGPGGIAQTCTVEGGHEAAVTRQCSTPQCLHAVCLEHWIQLGQDPQLFQLPATQWSCEDCQADIDEGIHADDSSEEECAELDPPPVVRQRGPAANRPPISCHDFLNLDQHIANVTATQRRLLDNFYSGLQLGLGDTAAQW